MNYRELLFLVAGGILGYDYGDFGDFTRLHHWMVGVVIVLYLFAYSIVGHKKVL